MTRFALLGIFIINAYGSQKFVEIPQNSAFLSTGKQSIFLSESSF